MERNRGGRPRHPDILTPAEWRVLEALRAGGTNTDIGRRLGVSPDTVKYHISNMLGKLHLGSRQELAAWRPDRRRRPLPALMPMVALSALRQPLLWGGVLVASLGAASVAVVLVIAQSSRPPQPVTGMLPAAPTVIAPARGDECRTAPAHPWEDRSNPVIAVVPGDRGVVTLAWTEGPADATRWRYRLREAYTEPWGEWTDIPDRDANERCHRVTGLPDGTTWIFELRYVAGTPASEYGEAVSGAVPEFDADGVPYMPLYQLVEGGRQWRVEATVLEIPAGTRVFAGVWPPGDPPSSATHYLVDAESESRMALNPYAGVACDRSLSPSPSGRDVAALFDRISGSARVAMDVQLVLGTAPTGERGVVSLRWYLAPDGVTHWEYRLRGPWRDAPWSEWMEIAGSDAGTRSHRVRGLPDGTSWGFQVRVSTVSTVSDFVSATRQRLCQSGRARWRMPRGCCGVQARRWPGRSC